jgi:hypothetical protein
MTRYLSGLCVAGLGLCGGGWLIVVAVAFGGAGAGGSGEVNLATGAGLILVSSVTAAAWAVAWRRRMRRDGVLVERFLIVSRREARRNRRDLARGVRRTARLSKRSARQARRSARRSARQADSEALGGTSGNSAAHHGNGRNGHALSGAGRNGAGVNGAGLNGNGYHGAGHDGTSAADVLGELRTLRALLGPLLAADGPVSMPPQAQARHRSASSQPAQPAGPRQAAGLLAGNDELLKLADSEEAWW